MQDCARLFHGWEGIAKRSSGTRPEAAGITFIFWTAAVIPSGS